MRTTMTYLTMFRSLQKILTLVSVLMLLFVGTSSVFASAYYNNTNANRLINDKNRAAVEKAFGKDISKLSVSDIQKKQAELGLTNQDGKIGADTIAAAVESYNKQTSGGTTTTGDTASVDGKTPGSDSVHTKLADGPDSLSSTQFRFDPNSISPSTATYNSGDKEGTSGGNTVQLLRKIARFLLIAISTMAVLFIIVGGFLMAISGGDTDRSTKGRTIITYNIQALIISMLAYGIIQFVIWII